MTRRDLEMRAGNVVFLDVDIITIALAQEDYHQSFRHFVNHYLNLAYAGRAM